MEYLIAGVGVLVLAVVPIWNLHRMGSLSRSRDHDEPPRRQGGR